MSEKPISPLRRRMLEDIDVRRRHRPPGSGKRVDMMYPVDNTFWTKLKDFIDYEPVSAIDPELRGVLASIGIIKGQPFKPTGKQLELLQEAVETAPKMIMARCASLAGRTGATSTTKTGSKKMSGAAAHPNGSRAVIWMSTSGPPTSRSPIPGSCTLGVGSKYPVALRDANGEFLNGLNTYKLRLPPNPPAALFWAVTAYNITDGTMVEAPQLMPSINGFNKVSTNGDGEGEVWAVTQRQRECRRVRSRSLPADRPKGTRVL